MPNSQDRGNRDFSAYENMTNEELEQILRLDAQNTEGEESDLEMLLYVMEVLAGRNRQSENAGKTPEEAFESFKRNYMPHDDSDSIPKLHSQQAQTPKAVVKKSRWLRSLSAVAAALAIVIVCSATAGAFGVDILGTVARWTKETFHFGTGSHLQETQPNMEAETSLQNTLREMKIFTPLAPTRIPEGYELVDVTTDETPARVNVFAIYENGEQVIKVQIKGFLDGDPQQVERSDSLVETYKLNGITYYIFSNNDQLRAVWINENYECYISGELTVEEMKSMIDSIQKE